jgi:hypothetical protein
MDIYEVLAAEATTTAQGTPIWMVSMRKPDGSVHCHTFPPSTIEWRMAEYAFDTIDEALDVVLHEPWAVDPTDPMQTHADPAAKAGMSVRRPGTAAPEPVRLHNAASVADARAAHRLRIADAKTRVTVQPPKGKPDPLDAIRRHGVTEDGLRLKTALVDAARCGVRGEPLPEETRRVLAALNPYYASKETPRA